MNTNNTKSQNMSLTQLGLTLNRLSTAIWAATMLGSVSILLAGLTGCASNSVMHDVHTHSLLNQSGTLDDIDNEQIGLSAKAQLNATYEAMLTRTFAYQTTITVSNDNRRYELDNATPEQLTNASSREEHCDYVHDNAYAQMLADYKNDGHDDISKLDTVAPYVTRIEQIKADYLSCYDDYMRWRIAEEKREREEYNAWLDEMYQDNAKNDDDSDDDSNKSVCSNDVSESDSQNDTNLTVGDKSDSTSIDEDKDLPTFMPNYDYNHTRLHRKKAKLLDAYLWQRANSTISGVYRPTSGQLTLLPTVSYQGQNLAFSISQPLFFDLRRGDIYIWADTLAIGVSEYLDDKLGTSWQHKWLKIALNDGTLPDGFSRDMLQAHIDASKVMLDNEENSNFSYINLTNTHDLSTLNKTEHVDLSQLPMSQYAIEHRQNLDDLMHAQQLYYQYIYETMSAKYPDFIKQALDDNSDDIDEDNDAVDHDDNNSDDKQAVSGDDAQDVNNEDDKQVNDDANKKDESLFSAKIFMTEYLKIVKQEAGIEEDDKEDDTTISAHRGQNPDNDDNSTNHDPDTLTCKVQPQEDDKDLEEAEPEYVDNQVKVLNQYGFNQRGDLKWWRYQIRFKSVDDFDEYQDNGEGMVVTSITTFSPITRDTVSFPSLPANVQRPTEANTVDLIDYAKTLQERYKQGEGAAFGRMILSGFEGYNKHDTQHSDSNSSDADAHESTNDNSDDQALDSDGHSNENIDSSRMYILP